MSFLDQLAKNLNTQTEFFTRLSNISRDSRTRSENKTELEMKSKADTQISPKTSNNNEVESKEKEDFKVEKEGFFTTAKKVFNEYKVKADSKTKDAKEPELKEELETADQALDLIFGLIDPQLQAQIELQQSELQKPDLSAALEALQVKPSSEEPDAELLDFFLVRIDLKLNSEIETLTKEIVGLDLNTDEGIAEILEISNNIEALQNVEKAVSDIKEELKALLQIDSSINTQSQEKTIKPEVELLVETKIDTKLNELKQANLEQVAEIQLEVKPEIKLENPEIKADTKVDLKAETQINLNEAEITLEEPEKENIKKVLDAVKASLKQEKASKDTSLKKPQANSNFDVKVLQEAELRSQNSKRIDFTKAQVEIIEQTDTGASDSKQESDFSSDNFETLFPKEIKVSNVKIKSLSKPISIKQLPEIITKETENVKPGAKQEVKMILDPENLGKMQMSITREDNQIHISMIVRTDEAQTKLEQKINDIKVALKDKGFEANIEVNKSDANNSNQTGQNQGQTKDGNEAKEEQREKYLNQVPQWISGDVEKLDFTEALNRAL